VIIQSTCGSTEEMMVAMLSVCNPGDKVIVFSPFYENYGADAIPYGAVPVYVPLRPPLFSFGPAPLRKAFEQRPKALIKCNPSNLYGKVLTRDELEYIIPRPRVESSKSEGWNSYCSYTYYYNSIKERVK
jgi:aspartate/methionine/tyrosine aminotransferase